MKKIILGKYVISEKSRPFVVAEAGVNYYDIAKKKRITPLEAAKLMVKEAAHSGANAIKFQSYKAENLAAKKSPSYWDTKKERTKSQYELFKKFDKFGHKEYQKIADYAKKCRILFMSTPFDEDSVQYLEKMMPVYKIASADITNLPLLKKIAKKGKPIFLSTGASTIQEIRESIDVIEHAGNKKIVLLHCVLNYPTPYKNANLNMIIDMKKNFSQYLIGYSDHTLPDKYMLLATSAILLGAQVIEKHFTLDKSIPGNDHYHAMDSKDLKTLKENIDFIKIIGGNYKKAPLPSERMAILNARRSIYAAQGIPKGTKISEEMLICKRPGTGIEPKWLYSIIGRKSINFIREDEMISWRKLSATKTE